MRDQQSIESPGDFKQGRERSDVQFKSSLLLLVRCRKQEQMQRKTIWWLQQEAR